MEKILLAGVITESALYHKTDGKNGIRFKINTGKDRNGVDYLVFKEVSDDFKDINLLTPGVNVYIEGEPEFMSRKEFGILEKEDLLRHVYCTHLEYISKSK
jgi:hypothetical protein